MFVRLFVMLMGLAANLPSPASAAGSGDLWQDVDPGTVPSPAQPDSPPAPDRYRLLRLDATLAKQRLDARSGGQRTSPVTIALPLPDGGYKTFRIEPSDVMPESLAERYPEIRSYAGVAIDDKTVRVRLDWSPSGLHAMIIGPRDVVFVEPLGPQQEGLYRSFFKRDARRLPWRELPPPIDRGDSGFPQRAPGDADASVNGSATGAQRRVYRLAVAANYRYSDYFGGSIPKVLASIVQAVNRIDGIYEAELSIKFRLVPQNDKIIFTDLNTDPFFNVDEEDLPTKNQHVLDRIIGSDGYDIGHVFVRSSGGLAELSSVCVAGHKAQGMTGSEVPEGDAFWVDYVAHEIGHQLGGNHTFNSPLGSCGDGNREPNSAYEIGSGITIMGYASLCGSDNVAKHSIPYFHVHSLDEISSNVWSGPGSACGVIQATGNTPPRVNANVAAGYYIPRQTPFFLEGTGKDPDGDTLTFSWEQHDLGSRPATVLQTLAQTPRSGLQPLFRSFPPTLEGRTRTLPRLAAALRNLPWGAKFEVLPNYGRTMAFRLTARDGRGGVASSAVRTVNVVNNAGPFAVTDPLEGNDWKANHDEIVRWAVAGTRASPIACENVDIDLSMDDGQQFRYPLARKVANTGRSTVHVPAGLKSSGDARIRIRCADNIFGAFSSKFEVQGDTP
ncbi:MAG: zinc-dependent metalloprotease family protein [Methylotetracoccus sp.]